MKPPNKNMDMNEIFLKSPNVRPMTVKCPVSNEGGGELMKSKYLVLNCSNVRLTITSRDPLTYYLSTRSILMSGGLWSF
jgi:hypothetical protein